MFRWQGRKGLQSPWWRLCLQPSDGWLTQLLCMSLWKIGHPPPGFGMWLFCTHLQQHILVLVLDNLIKVLADNNSHTTICGLVRDGGRLELRLHGAIQQALGELVDGLLTATRHASSADIVAQVGG